METRRKRWKQAMRRGLFCSGRKQFEMAQDRASKPAGIDPLFLGTGGKFCTRACLSCKTRTGCPSRFCTVGSISPPTRAFFLLPGNSFPTQEGMETSDALQPLLLGSEAIYACTRQCEQARRVGSLFLVTGGKFCTRAHLSSRWKHAGSDGNKRCAVASFARVGSNLRLHRTARASLLSRPSFFGIGG